MLDDYSITVTFPSQAASFAALAVENRMEQIHKYHADHPELPRQDDVLHVYSTALQCLNAALPEYARVPVPVA